MKTDVARAGIAVVTDTFADGFHVTVGNDGIDETIATVVREVVVGEAQSTQIADIVDKRQVPANVRSRQLAGSTWVRIEDDSLLRDEHRSGAEGLPCQLCVLRRDEVGVGAHARARRQVPACVAPTPPAGAAGARPV